MKPPGGIEEMNASGRSIRVFAVLLGVFVGRDKPCQRNGRVQAGEPCQRDTDFGAAGQVHWIRIRGSAR
jgi:hypothetical protein